MTLSWSQQQATKNRISSICSSRKSTRSPACLPWSSANQNNCKIYEIICSNKVPYKRQQKSKELSQLAEQREARKEDGSVKGDKTVRDSRSAYLVRSIVSAQPVIICTAEAGLQRVYCRKGRFTSGKRVFPRYPVSPMMMDRWRKQIVQLNLDVLKALLASSQRQSTPACIQTRWGLTGRDLLHQILTYGSNHKCNRGGLFSFKFGLARVYRGGTPSRAAG